MPSLIEAIEIKRKMFFEFENAPYHCVDVEVSRPTARGGQTLVRIKMRNLITRAVFDRTFKAGEKFKDPDLVVVPATFLYADGDGFHFLDQESFETLTLGAALVGDRSITSRKPAPPSGGRICGVVSLTGELRSITKRELPLRKSP